ncbi:MAG: DUF4956 domain-containing protein [Eubacteriales bacterium]
MLDSFFKGIFDSDAVKVIAPADFLLCVGCALVCGIILTSAYVVKTKFTHSFAATLAMLPAVVAVVIMMVNGNIGAGVAVAGAFSLVRFRSVPGTAREIGAIFLAMGTGLVCGMGYLGYALLISVLLGAISLAYNLICIGAQKKGVKNKVLRITIPEDLDYTDVFESILSEYTTRHELVQVKTTNMGSLFRLTYDVTVKNIAKEKELIDKLRVRNGNLEITVSRQETAGTEL